jgi:hypothetical protein
VVVEPVIRPHHPATSLIASNASRGVASTVIVVVKFAVISLLLCALLSKREAGGLA